MKAALFLYLKVFLLMGIPFGLIMSLTDLAFGDGFDMDLFIYRASFFGTWMAVIFVTMHLLVLKGLGITNFTHENLKVKQSKALQSPVDKEALLEKLRSDPTFGKMHLTEKENEIDLKTRTSLWSWGELISIKSKPSNGLNDYIIESKPKLNTTLVDFGQNMRNVKRLEKLIS